MHENFLNNTNQQTFYRTENKPHLHCHDESVNDFLKQIMATFIDTLCGPNAKFLVLKQVVFIVTKTDRYIH